MKARFQAHAVVTLITNAGDKIIFDPFINGNDNCPLDAESIDPDVIFVTHAHSDHIGDTIEIAKRTEAQVVTTVEIADYLATQEIEAHGMQPGGAHTFDFGRVKFFPAIHGSSLEIDGKPQTLGLASGILFEADGKTIYHMGDTALYSDMKLIGEFEDIDLAFIPIGDNFTMGIEDAVYAAKWTQAKKVVPIHYNTFPLIEQDPKEYINKLDEGVGVIPELNTDIEF